MIEDLTQVGTVHDVKDTFNTILPVLTLVLGAWLARWTKKSDVRSTMRIEAADLLADLPSRLWQQGGDDDWLNLKTAISRLSVRLAMTGLPTPIVTALGESAITFWYGVEQVHPDDTSLSLRPDKSKDWDRMSELVSEWLSTNSGIRRWTIERAYSRNPLEPPSMRAKKKIRVEPTT